ncbi:ras-specific guanine nucleotide-releasing factor RalGPS2 [Trichonephila clavipes]|nr:ras-specific guanine nucleotide-releasing factor RalGPS2 [Trichonephila clavipes]
MALGAWYWLKRTFAPAPHVRVPSAAFLTDVKAMVYAEQLMLLDAAAFERSDFSELGLSLPEAKHSPDSVTFKHLSEWIVRTILAQFCPEFRARNVSHFIDIVAILHQMRSVHHRKAQGHLVWCPPRAKRRTFRTLWELLCCPHETDTNSLTSKMEKVFSSEPFHQSVSFDHLRVWPNIQHLLEPCHFTEINQVGMRDFHLHGLYGTGSMKEYTSTFPISTFVEDSFRPRPIFMKRGHFDNKSLLNNETK